MEKWREGAYMGSVQGSLTSLAGTAVTPISHSVRLPLAHLHANNFITEDSGQNVKCHVNIYWTTERSCSHYLSIYRKIVI